MPPDLLTSGGAQGPSGWTSWTAQGTSPTCGGALRWAGGGTTAGTRRTQGSSAQVCPPGPRGEELGLGPGLLAEAPQQRVPPCTVRVCPGPWPLGTLAPLAVPVLALLRRLS